MISKEWRSLSLRGAKMRMNRRWDAKVNRTVITLKKMMILLWKPLKENQNWYVNTCIIILLKKSPLCNLNMLSDIRYKIWTSYYFITDLQQTINKEKCSPSLFLENKSNKKIYFCKPYSFFFFLNKRKTKLRLWEIRVGRKEITMLLIETQINVSSVSGCLATHQC